MNRNIDPYYPRYKLYWSKSNKPTPVVDKVVFNKIKVKLLYYY